MDFSGVDGHPNSNTVGRIYCLIIASMQHTDEETAMERISSRPRAKYFDNQNLTDPFLDPFLIQPEDDVVRDD